MGWVSNDSFYAIRFILVTGSSSLVSIVLALTTRAEPMDKLCEFYRRLRPYGWWGPVATACPESRHGDPVWLLWAMSLMGVTFVFGGIFSAAGLLLAYWWLFFIALVVCASSFAFLRYGTNRLYPLGSVDETL
jgi:SSS family solute:Na+ symporter